MNHSSDTLKKSPKLVVLSAPSGAGKSTLATLLMKKYSKYFQTSVSYTTRNPRGSEKNGVHYFFVSDEEFKKMIKQNDFLEYALVFKKYWYGTSKSFVNSVTNQGKNVLFDIDIQGARNLKKSYGQQCITVFILPPSFEELKVRLIKRNTESSSDLEARLETAKHELESASEFDYQITNDNVDKAFLELEAILGKENCI